MALTPGTRLGAYEIAGRLGAGGMGEVYRAVDTRLGRPVALKVLGAETAFDAASRDRFEREARLIAQLQHPHICVLHDVGRVDGAQFLVMELLDGETLEKRLQRGRLTLDEAQTVGAQVAQALDAAHRCGIVHRDLKPANIMLVKAVGGAACAKLLDFGIAKPIDRVGDPAEPALDETHTARLATAPHVVLGTLFYMAPEQLSGQGADARTDIWALGCVLYEMVSGTRPFAAASTAGVMAAILDHAPPPLEPALGPIVAIINRCLQKDPERRWQDAGDLAATLGWQHAGGNVPPKPAKPPARSLGWTAAVVAAITAGLAGWAWGARVTVAPARPPTRLAVVAPTDTSFLGGRAAPHVALSPDSRRLAFVPTPFGRSAGIWVRDLDATAARLLPETTGAIYPFWSPDGTRLGFFADGKLKIINADGGRPLTVCDAPTPRGGTWSPLDVILFTPSLDTGLYRVPVGGGVPEAVTRLDAARREINHKLPAFLPDGRRFVFVNQAASADGTGLSVGSIDSPATMPLLNVASKAQFASGFLWYAKDGALVAHAFNPDTTRLEGAPHPTGDEVATRNTVIGDATFAVGSDGTVVVWNGPQAAATELTWFDRSGRRLGAIGTVDRHFSIVLSPDERTIVAEIQDPEGPFYNIWTIDAASGVKTRITSGSLNWGPVWSPIGDRLAYGSLRNGPSQVSLRGMAGGPGESTAWKSGDFTGPTGWTPDGESLVLLDVSHFRIGLLPLSPSAVPRWITDGAFVEGDGRVSPDGRWLAYTSNESGTWEVYVKTFPALDRKWRVSPAGGSGPSWRGDSSELFYLDPDQHLMALAMGQGSTPPGPPARLFALPIVPTPPGIDPRLMYAPAARGDRFLVNAAVATANVSPLTAVLDVVPMLRAKAR